jgi:hypothetical protein
VHRAGPAAPLARLLPLPPVAVTAEPAVAGAVWQVALGGDCGANAGLKVGFLVAGMAAGPMTARRFQPALADHL